jgi:hypothetical protein
MKKLIEAIKETSPLTLAVIFMGVVSVLSVVLILVMDSIH